MNSINKTEVVEKTKRGTKRYPNLSTVILIEDFLKAHRDLPMTVAELRRSLPKQVMHQTLVTTLSYLQASSKVFIGSKGVSGCTMNLPSCESFSRVDANYEDACQSNFTWSGARGF